MLKVTKERASWVNVTVTGDPQLAKEVKAFLGLVLDWVIIEDADLLKAISSLKLYQPSTALTSMNRLQFNIARNRERDMSERAGFVIEKKRG